jgi:branched-chain amino acid transport system permease protein
MVSVDVLLDGVFSGAVYALVALGLAIVFQPTRIMNFAQGEAVVLGAAVGYQAVALWKLDWLAALGLTVVVAVVLGLVMERLIILPVRLSGSRYAWIIATLAVALVFQSLFTLAYLDVPALRPTPPLSGHVSFLGGVIDWQELLTVVAALAVMGGYDVFLRRSAHGQAIRAASHNPDTAVLMGIPVQRVVVLSFVIGTVVTALAGLLASPVIFVAPASGLLFTIKGFTAAVIGGVGSPRGALAGGLIVGLLDTVVRSTISGTAGNFAVFAALAVILVLFPSGLFGKPMEAH